MSDSLAMWQQAGILILSSAGFSKLFTIIFEKNIGHKYEKEIKRLESELEQKNFRHSTVFIKTEESISGVYERLIKVMDILEDHTFLMAADDDRERKKERVKKLNDAFNNFYDFYRPRKIYIRKSTQEKTQALMETSISLLRTFDMSNTLRNTKPLTPAGLEAQEKLDVKFEKLQNQITPLLSALQDDFQSILGFPKEESKFPKEESKK